MEYNKTLVGDGEEYPYDESFDDGSYLYKISVIWEENDGELIIIKEGSHIQYDNGSWLDFNLVPEEIYPHKQKLSEDELLHLMNLLANSETRLYSKDEMEVYFHKYEKLRNSNQLIDPTWTTPVLKATSNYQAGHE